MFNSDIKLIASTHQLSERERRKRAIKILDQIVDVFDANRKTHRLFANTRAGEFFGRQLTMRCRRRVRDKRFGVADIDKSSEQLQRVLEFRARSTTAFDAERQNARCTP
jgi:hypothetical protein